MKSNKEVTSAFARLALATGILMGAALTCASAGPSWPVPPDVKTVEVNGYPIAYLEAGKGVPIVILHGAWVDYRFFAPHVVEFSKTNRAIAVSLRHHFPEQWDGKEGAFSVNQHASDVVGLIRQLNLGKVHLLGHSRGGAVAINVARLAPELIRTLILPDANGLETLLPEDSLVRKQTDLWPRFGVWVRGQLDASDRRKTAQVAWDRFNGPGAWEKIAPDMQQVIVDNIGTMATKTPFDSPSINCDDIRKFNFPILILHGERSPKSYSEMELAMRQCKSDIAAPTVVPDAGHNMHYNNPKFFNQVVLEYMQRN